MLVNGKTKKKTKAMLLQELTKQQKPKPQKPRIEYSDDEEEQNENELTAKEIKELKREMQQKKEDGESEEEEEEVDEYEQMFELMTYYKNNIDEWKDLTEDEFNDFVDKINRNGLRDDREYKKLVEIWKKHFYEAEVNAVFQPDRPYRTDEEDIKYLNEENVRHAYDYFENNLSDFMDLDESEAEEWNRVFYDNRLSPLDHSGFSNDGSQVPIIRIEWSASNLIIPSDTDEDKANEYNEAIDEILKHIEDGKQKGFLFQPQGSDKPKSKLNNAFIKLIPLLKVQELNNALGNVNEELSGLTYSKNKYAGMAFKRDGDRLIWNAVGTFTAHPDGELYLDLLAGAGGGYSIFDAVKKLFNEDKGENDMVNLKHIAYLDLSAINTYNTLQSYDTQGGELLTTEFKNKEKYIIEGAKDIQAHYPDAIKRMEEAEKTKKELTKQMQKYPNRNYPPELKEKIKEVNKIIENEWNSHFKNKMGGLTNFNWVFLTSNKKKFLKDHPEYNHLKKFNIDTELDKAFYLLHHPAPKPAPKGRRRRNATLVEEVVKAPKPKPTPAPKPAPTTNKQKSDYKIIQIIDDFFKKIINLEMKTDAEHYKRQIAEWKKQIAGLRSRRLRSARSIEQNNDRIANLEMHLNDFQQRLKNIPNVIKEIAELEKKFKKLFKENFNDVYNEVDKQRIHLFNHSPYASFYDDKKNKPLIDRLIKNYNKN